MDEWKEIKCKGCGVKEGRMFMMPKPQSSDDVWCQKCAKKELEKRVEGDKNGR